MKASSYAVFLLGVAAMAALVAYAGTGNIGQALATLGFGGLAIVALIHLPVIALLGLAWWSIGHNIAHATPWKFIWARFVRESAAEVLPFSQVGGFVIGIRSLSLTGLRTLPSAVSMAVDLTVEFSAKLPYLLVGIALLLLAAPGSDLLGPVGLAAFLTAAGVLGLLVFRKRVRAVVEAIVIRVARRWSVLALETENEIRASFDRLSGNGDRIVSCFAMHLLCWSLGAFETWVMLNLMGVGVSAIEAVVIDSLVCGFRTFGFVVPAALGVQEGSYVLVCALFGISPADAVALSLVRRGREFVIGIPGLALWQAVEGKRAFATPAVDGDAVPPLQ